MDAKDLRKEAALGDHNDVATNYTQSGAAVEPSSRPKTYQDMGSSPMAKAEVAVSRPCAVIGPDRVVPPADAYLLKHHESWPIDPYRRPPDYPLKLHDYQNPTRNISPRQTFQENMQRIMVPPTYAASKPKEDCFQLESNISPLRNKVNVSTETKFSDVPYAVNPIVNDPKNVRTSDVSVPNINSVLTRSAPQAWSPVGAQVRPAKTYSASELYQYPDYTSCAAPRPMYMGHPQRSALEESGHLADPYHNGNIRFKPYPTPSMKDRYLQPRYDYMSNYPNPVQAQSVSLSHHKTIPSNSNPGYSQVPLKYMDSRLSDPLINSYQRPANPQTTYSNLAYRNQVIHPSYGTIQGNCLQPNKFYPYPDTSSKAMAAKLPPYPDFEGSRPKPYPVPDGYYINDVARSHSMKAQVMPPNYPAPNLHMMHPHPYYRKESLSMKSFDHGGHYRNIDPSININANALPRFTSQFPNAVAISSDSMTHNTTNINPQTYQQDFSYINQSPSVGTRGFDHDMSRFPNDPFRRYEYNYGPVHNPPPVQSKCDPYLISEQSSKDKKDLDVRKFLEMWNEGEEDSENNTKNISKTVPLNTLSPGTHVATNTGDTGNQEQLYVMGIVNVPREELDKYEHIQKVSKLPENIKGYNSIEILHKFEEVIESSNLNDHNSSHLSSRDYRMPPKNSASLQVPPKNSVPFQLPKNSLPQQPAPKNSVLFQQPPQNLVPYQTMHVAMPRRPLSPLDVESKISQSVIHKEVGCNFEIKPCSPKMMNAERAAPVEDIMSERVIEKVSNPIGTPPSSNKIPVESPDVTIATNCQDQNISLIDQNIKSPCCKMAGTQYLKSDIDVIKKPNYTLQDLESNSGVCLASLPRLDNDIELSFPEVNQQFINANKMESVITSKPLQGFDRALKDVGENLQDKQSQTQSKNDHHPKLNKYRKMKRKSTESMDKSCESSKQGIRTDSVIIKNPDTNKIFEDISVKSPNCKADGTPQRNPINLTKNTDYFASVEESMAAIHNEISDDSAIDFSLHSNDRYQGYHQPNPLSIDSHNNSCELQLSLESKNDVISNPKNDLGGELGSPKFNEKSKFEKHFLNKETSTSFTCANIALANLKNSQSVKTFSRSQTEVHKDTIHYEKKLKIAQNTETDTESMSLLKTLTEDYQDKSVVLPHTDVMVIGLSQAESNKKIVNTVSISCSEKLTTSQEIKKDVGEEERKGAFEVDANKAAIKLDMKKAAREETSIQQFGCFKKNDTSPTNEENKSMVDSVRYTIPSVTVTECSIENSRSSMEQSSSTECFQTAYKLESEINLIQNQETLSEPIAIDQERMLHHSPTVFFDSPLTPLNLTPENSMNHDDVMKYSDTESLVDITKNHASFTENEKHFSHNEAHFAKNDTHFKSVSSFNKEMFSPWIRKLILREEESFKISEKKVLTEPENISNFEKENLDSETENISDFKPDNVISDSESKHISDCSRKNLGNISTQNNRIDVSQNCETVNESTGILNANQQESKCNSHIEAKINVNQLTTDPEIKLQSFEDMPLSCSIFMTDKKVAENLSNPLNKLPEEIIDLSEHEEPEEIINLSEFENHKDIIGMSETEVPKEIIVLSESDKTKKFDELNESVELDLIDLTLLNDCKQAENNDLTLLNEKSTDLSESKQAENNDVTLLIECKQPENITDLSESEQAENITDITETGQHENFTDLCKSEEYENITNLIECEQSKQVTNLNEHVKIKTLTEPREPEKITDLNEFEEPEMITNSEEPKVITDLIKSGNINNFSESAESEKIPTLSESADFLKFDVQSKTMEPNQYQENKHIGVMPCHKNSDINQTASLDEDSNANILENIVSSNTSDKNKFLNVADKNEMQCGKHRLVKDESLVENDITMLQAESCDGNKTPYYESLTSLDTGNMLDLDELNDGLFNKFSPQNTSEESSMDEHVSDEDHTSESEIDIKNQDQKSSQMNIELNREEMIGDNKIIDKVLVIEEKDFFENGTCYTNGDVPSTNEQTINRKELTDVEYNKVYETDKAPSINLQVNEKERIDEENIANGKKGTNKALLKKEKDTNEEAIIDKVKVVCEKSNDVTLTIDDDIRVVHNIIIGKERAKKEHTEYKETVNKNLCLNYMVKDREENCVINGSVSDSALISKKADIEFQEENNVYQEKSTDDDEIKNINSNKRIDDREIAMPDLSHESLQSKLCSGSEAKVPNTLTKVLKNCLDEIKNIYGSDASDSEETSSENEVDRLKHDYASESESEPEYSNCPVMSNNSCPDENRKQNLKKTVEISSSCHSEYKEDLTSKVTEYSDVDSSDEEYNTDETYNSDFIWKWESQDEKQNAGKSSPFAEREDILTMRNPEKDEMFQNIVDSENNGSKVSLIDMDLSKKGKVASFTRYSKYDEILSMRNPEKDVLQNFPDFKNNNCKDFSADLDMFKKVDDNITSFTRDIEALTIKYPDKDEIFYEENEEIFQNVDYPKNGCINAAPKDLDDSKRVYKNITSFTCDIENLPRRYPEKDEIFKNIDDSKNNTNEFSIDLDVSKNEYPNSARLTRDIGVLDLMTPDKDEILHNNVGSKKNNSKFVSIDMDVSKNSELITDFPHDIEVNTMSHPVKGENFQNNVYSKIDNSKFFSLDLDVSKKGENSKIFTRDFDAVQGLTNASDDNHHIDFTLDSSTVAVFEENPESTVDNDYQDELLNTTIIDVIEESYYDCADDRSASIPKSTLKRSFSDSDLSNLKDDHDIICPRKRARCDPLNSTLSYTKLYQKLSKSCGNSIQNSRRNSITCISNEAHVSFCILIDNDCLMPDCSDSDKLQSVTEIIDDSIACVRSDPIVGGIDSSAEIVSFVEEMNEYSNNFGEDGTEESHTDDSWVHDVACVETVVSDDIAEDIVISASTPTSELSNSEYDDESELNINDHTEKVKFIYGDKMCNNDAHILETLYRTPQMNVNKQLVNKKSQNTDHCDTFYDKDTLENALTEQSVYPEVVYEPESVAFNTSSLYSLDLDVLGNDKENMDLVTFNSPASPFSGKDANEPNELSQTKVSDDNEDKTQDDTVHSCESSTDNVFSYDQNGETPKCIISSSPEVSSTTSEEKNSSILLKITNLRAARVSHAPTESHNRISCKYTETNDYLRTDSKVPARPLITKAAQKYIPPLKETIPNLKVKLTLPQQSLLKLKQMKMSKESHTLSIKVENKPNVLNIENRPNVVNIENRPKVVNNLRKDIPKKLKPKFEDVLKNIEEIQFQMHKENSKKTKKSIPRVVIKKNGNGSHYASTSNVSPAPDLTGRKWQPWVFLEKSHFIDKMARTGHMRAIFNRRKNRFVLAEKFKKYKSVASSKFVISKPKIENSSSGRLKYTIRLKQSC